jgi:hypothetical protein
VIAPRHALIVANRTRIFPITRSPFRFTRANRPGSRRVTRYATVLSPLSQNAAESPFTRQAGPREQRTNLGPGLHMKPVIPGRRDESHSVPSPREAGRG